MSWSAWVSHFESQSTRPLPDVGRGLEAIPLELRGPLARSIARFQRGETGEGRIAKEVRAAGWDPIYCEALRLFIAEEGRHARILGRALGTLGGRPAPDAWSARVFTAGRRVLDTRFELVALLGAEVAACAAYGAMVDKLPDCGLRDALAQLVADERHHLDFHAELFRGRAVSAHERAAFVAALGAVVALAGPILLADHAELWEALGVSRGELVARLRESTALAIRRSDPARPAPIRASMAA